MLFFLGEYLENFYYPIWYVTGHLAGRVARRWTLSRGLTSAHTPGELVYIAYIRCGRMLGTIRVIAFGNRTAGHTYNHLAVFSAPMEGIYQVKIVTRGTSRSPPHMNIGI